jgi:hypothetical protein
MAFSFFDGTMRDRFLTSLAADGSTPAAGFLPRQAAVEFRRRGESP